MIELAILGSTVGVLSGFFGIGGGTILVPFLLFLGYDIKTAISISVVQMVYSSVYGSYLNNKKGSLDLSMTVVVGLGGSLGALLSGYITSNVSDQVLELIFLSFAIFALLRLFFKTKEYREQIKLNPALLFLIGFSLGVVSMTIGVGGSIILVPILVGFLHVPLKEAISAGLFFVVFSSVAGMISHIAMNDVKIFEGSIIGFSSLFGVYLGIYFKDKVNELLQKRLLMIFYFLVVLYLISRMI